MRYVVIAMLLAIVASLGSAAFFMCAAAATRGMARALAWRVGLSVALFVLLIAGYALGLIQPGSIASRRR